MSIAKGTLRFLRNLKADCTVGGLSSGALKILQAIRRDGAVWSWSGALANTASIAIVPKHWFGHGLSRGSQVLV